MKKLYGFLIVAFGVVLLTGCGGSKSDFKCTAKMEENGETAEAEFNIKLDENEKVKSIDVTLEFEKEEYVTQLSTMYTWYNSMLEDEDQKIDFTVSGKKMTIKNYEKLANTETDDDDDNDNESLTNVVGMTKDQFKATLEKMDTVKDVSCK